MHPRGFVNSRWEPNGAPLGFCEFAVGTQWFVNSLWNPNGAPFGFCEIAVGP